MHSSSPFVSPWVPSVTTSQRNSKHSKVVPRPSRRVVSGDREASRLVISSRITCESQSNMPSNSHVSLPALYRTLLPLKTHTEKNGENDYRRDMGREEVLPDTWKNTRWAKH